MTEIFGYLSYFVGSGLALAIIVGGGRLLRARDERLAEVRDNSHTPPKPLPRPRRCLEPASADLDQMVARITPENCHAIQFEDRPIA